LLDRAEARAVPELLLRPSPGGEDRNARDRYIDYPFYEDCVEFCERFDQNCFDPDYDSLPLEFFRPIVEDVFREPRHAADDLGVCRALSMRTAYDSYQERTGRDIPVVILEPH
jgi:predicted HD phosphohydrolase